MVVDVMADVDAVSGRIHGESRCRHATHHRGRQHRVGVGIHFHECRWIPVSVVEHPAPDRINRDAVWTLRTEETGQDLVRRSVEDPDGDVYRPSVRRYPDPIRDRIDSRSSPRAKKLDTLSMSANVEPSKIRNVPLELRT